MVNEEKWNCVKQQNLDLGQLLKYAPQIIQINLVFTLFIVYIVLSVLIFPQNAVFNISKIKDSYTHICKIHQAA